MIWINGCLLNSFILNFDFVHSFDQWKSIVTSGSRQLIELNSKIVKIEFSTYCCSPINSLAIYHVDLQVLHLNTLPPFLWWIQRMHPIFLNHRKDQPIDPMYQPNRIIQRRRKNVLLTSGKWIWRLLQHLLSVGKFEFWGKQRSVLIL